MLVVACGFSLNSLPQEPELNPCVQTTGQLIKKLRFFVDAAEKIAEQPDATPEKQVNFELVVS